MSGIGNTFATEEGINALIFWIGIGELWQSLTRRQKQIMRERAFDQAKPITIRALEAKGLIEEGELTQRGKACLYIDQPKNTVNGVDL